MVGSSITTGVTAQYLDRLSMLNIENSDAQKPSDFHQGHYELTNLLYHPVRASLSGASSCLARELIFATALTSMIIIQFSFEYDWRKVSEF